MTDVDGREGAHFEDGPLAGRVVQERAGEHAIESRYEPSGLRVERRTDLGHRSQYDFDGAGDLRGVSFGLDPRRYLRETLAKLLAGEKDPAALAPETFARALAAEKTEAKARDSAAA